MTPQTTQLSDAKPCLFDFEFLRQRTQVADLQSLRCSEHTPKSKPSTTGRPGSADTTNNGELRAVSISKQKKYLKRASHEKSSTPSQQTRDWAHGQEILPRSDCWHRHTTKEENVGNNEEVHVGTMVGQNENRPLFDCLFHCVEIGRINSDLGRKDSLSRLPSTRLPKERKTSEVSFARAG